LLFERRLAGSKTEALEPAYRRIKRRMMALDRVVAQVAWPMALTLFALLGGVVGFVVIRRIRRDYKSRLLDQTQILCKAILEELAGGAIHYSDALDRLRRLPKVHIRTSLASILAEDRNPSPERAETLRKLCEDLGLVALWRRRLAAGRLSTVSKLASYLSRHRGPLNFVLRAEAAEYLGIICHRPSWPLLVGALDDPSATVRSAAVRNLARILEPDSFEALADRLESVAEDPAPSISVRSLKMALASFPATEAVRLRRLLEHCRPRVRVLAGEVVALMVQHEAAEGGNRDAGPHGLAPEVVEIFLTRLATDEDPDVRARAADVVAHFDLFRALPVLTHLLGDPVWFVRMHAVRAFRRQRLAPLAAVTQRLTDPHWRVREAAARTLAARGRSGVRRLFEHFLSTEDRYSQDQVAEQIARAGLLSSVIERYGEFGHELETRFVEELVMRGFGHILLTTLRNGVRPEKSQVLIQDLSRHSNGNVEMFLRQCAGSASVEQGIIESRSADQPGTGSHDEDQLPAVVEAS
jgi:HEAT repeat protein